MKNGLFQLLIFIRYVNFFTYSWMLSFTDEWWIKSYYVPSSHFWSATLVTTDTRVNNTVLYTLRRISPDETVNHWQDIDTATYLFVFELKNNSPLTESILPTECLLSTTQQRPQCTIRNSSPADYDDFTNCASEIGTNLLQVQCVATTFSKSTVW